MMKKSIKGLILILVLTILVTLVACDKASDNSLEGEISDLAVQFVDHLIAEDFVSAVAYFDGKMKKAIPESTLSQTWSQLQQQIGRYESKIGYRVEEIQGYDVVFVTCQFEQEVIDIRVVFNSGKEIAGLFFEPVKDSNLDIYSPPAYIQPSSFTEKEIIVGEGEWALPGTLTIPNGEGPFPAVVLVHGSGPSDRDETIGPNKPFKDLAWGLASQNIAVLRYDKRTLVHGQKLAFLEDGITVDEETIIDAHRAIDLLLDEEKIDKSKIYIIGHSLGGTLAPRIANNNEHIAGLVILGGAARPLEELILMQIKYIAELDGVVTKEEEAQIKVIEQQVANIRDPLLSNNTPASQLLGVPASYWLDLRGYNPVNMAKSLSIPILILHGERDYQVTMDDFNLWKDGLDGNYIYFKSYPKLNHLFIEGEGKSIPTEYENSGNVNWEVIRDINDWITTIK